MHWELISARLRPSFPGPGRDPISDSMPALAAGDGIVGGALLGRALALPVVGRDRAPAQAWIAGVCDGPLGDFERLILQQSATVVALELMRVRVRPRHGAPACRRHSRRGTHGSPASRGARRPAAPVRPRRARSRCSRSQQATRSPPSRCSTPRSRVPTCGRSSRSAALLLCAIVDAAGARSDPRSPGDAAGDARRRGRNGAGRPAGPPAPTRCGAASTRRAARWRPCASPTAPPPRSPRIATSDRFTCCCHDRTTRRCAHTATACWDGVVVGRPRLRRRAAALARRLPRAQRPLGARGGGRLLSPPHAALPHPPRRGADEPLRCRTRATGSSSGWPCAPRELSLEAAARSTSRCSARAGRSRPRSCAISPSLTEVGRAAAARSRRRPRGPGGGRARRRNAAQAMALDARRGPRRRARVRARARQRGELPPEPRRDAGRARRPLRLPRPRRPLLDDRRVSSSCTSASRAPGGSRCSAWAPVRARLTYGRARRCASSAGSPAAEISRRGGRARSRAIRRAAHALCAAHAARRARDEPRRARRGASRASLRRSARRRRLASPSRSARSSTIHTLHSELQYVRCELRRPLARASGCRSPRRCSERLRGAARRRRGGGRGGAGGGRRASARAVSVSCRRDRRRGRRRGPRGAR